MQPTEPNKFTEQAWSAIVKSQDVARRYLHQYLEVEHLILALLAEEGIADKILLKAGIEPSQLEEQLDAFAKRQPKVGNASDLYLGRSLDVLLDVAETTRETWEDQFIAVEHLLIAFWQDQRIGNKLLTGGNRPNVPSRPGFEQPKNNSLSLEKLELAIKAVRGKAKVDSQNQEANYDALSKYGRDLTELAANGKLDPVIGRDEEIRRVISC
ncbi:MAG: Clp protease N-terminal domain-containing protein, partial [Microcoleaceae cyanobacterium]